MASPCLCKPPLASEPASHVKPVTKQMFGKASSEAAREAASEALPNRAKVSIRSFFTGLLLDGVRDSALLLSFFSRLRWLYVVRCAAFRTPPECRLKVWGVD